METRWAGRGREGVPPLRRALPSVWRRAAQPETVNALRAHERGAP